MQGQELIRWFNRRPRIGALCTAMPDGQVNAAVFGSPYLIDENTMAMGIGPNRTLKYLRNNPQAVFIVIEPGKRSMDWRGARFYLHLEEIALKGAFFEAVQANILDRAGAISADTMVAALKFSIERVRPLIDGSGRPVILYD